MAQSNAQAVWESSLAGRLFMFLATLWHDSLLGRALGAVGRFVSRMFLDSWLGRVWYSDWPAPGYVAQSRTGHFLAGLGSLAERLGRRAGPWLAGLWETSLLGRLWRVVAGFLGPFLSTSILWNTYTGFSSDAELAPAETGRRPTSPIVYLLGTLLGVVPLVPSTFGGILSPTVIMVAGVWGVAIIWLARKAMLGELRWRASAVFLPLAAFLVIAVTATVQSASFSGSLLSLAIWSTALLLFWMIVNEVRNTRDAAALLGPVMAVSLLITLWAFYQLRHPPVIEEAWVDPSQGNITRPFASFANPNYLAEYMELYLPLVVALWLQLPKRRLEMTAIVLAMGLALILPQSRGGWLAEALALGIFVVLRFRALAVLMIPAGLAGLALAPQSLITRLMSSFSGQDTSTIYRTNIWKGIQAMLGKFWLLGAGLGAEAFGKVYAEFMLPAARAAHAHNVYLQMFAEVGIFGLIAILWAVFEVVRRLTVAGADQRRSPLVAAVPAALVGLMFHGLVEHIWYNPKLLFAFWAVAALGMGLALGDREEARA